MYSVNYRYNEHIVDHGINPDSREQTLMNDICVFDCPQSPRRGKWTRVVVITTMCRVFSFILVRN